MRIQVALSEEMVKRVDALAESYGVNRSSFCAMLIGQSVNSLEQASVMVQQALDQGIGKAVNGASQKKPQKK